MTGPGPGGGDLGRDPAGDPAVEPTEGPADGPTDGPLTTPDGRYLVVRGRLWRRSNPSLEPEQRERWVRELMSARRAKGTASRSGDAAGREAARRRVQAAKEALGERGPVWWDDGAPDLTRRMARTTPYADWYAAYADQAAHADHAEHP